MVEGIFDLGVSFFLKKIVTLIKFTVIKTVIKGFTRFLQDPLYVMCMIIKFMESSLYEFFCWGNVQFISVKN